MPRISTILLPTRPQPDTIVAIFLLRIFGAERFPGIETATVEVQKGPLPDASFEGALARGVLPLDVGGGPLDHHGTDLCASEIVAKYLNIEKDPALHQVLVYARRDDKEGRGIISKDGIDRAFGLSGLIASLNKVHVNAPHVVESTVLPLLTAHYKAALEHHVELPAEVAEKRKRGLYEEFTVNQNGKPVLVSCVVSDKPSMPGYLRSSTGPRADVIVQKLEDTNHMSILSRRERVVDLSRVAGLVRLHEAELRGLPLTDDEKYLMQTGALAELAHWYYDPATNSLLNGGPHNRAVEASRIAWDNMKRLVRAGIEMGSVTEKRGNSSYYLSINIPMDAASRILRNLVVHPEVKAHPAEQLHVTLEFFGAKVQDDIESLGERIGEALKDKKAFSLTLRHDQLASGLIEGFTDAGAWHLALPGEEVAHIHDLRSAVLAHVDMPARDKQLHVTLAAKPKGKRLADHAVRTRNPFTEELTVSEIVLMESAPGERGRVYRPFRTYPLS